MDQNKPLHNKTPDVVKRSSFAAHMPLRYAQPPRCAGAMQRMLTIPKDNDQRIDEVCK